MRKVIVISMNSNPDKIITSNGIGYVESDLNKIIKILNDLINNNMKIKELGDKAYKYAIQYHSTKKNLDKIIKLMNL